MSTGYEDYIQVNLNFFLLLKYWFDKEKKWQDLVAALLINGDYNVIITHWGPGSGSSALDYSQGIANIRVVGLEIAFLVNTMVV